MDRRTTGWIAALAAGSAACFCCLLFLLFSGLLAGSVPLLGSLLVEQEAVETQLPTLTSTPDISRATVVVPRITSTSSPYDAVYEEALLIEQQVSLLRGLEVSTPILCEFYTREDLHRLLEQDDPILSLPEPDRFTFFTLGLYDDRQPPALDENVPAEILLAVFDEQEAGRCSVLWEDPGQPGWQTAYARSFARTLVRSKYSDVSGETCGLFVPPYDHCLAERALLEGDAYLAARQWQRQFGGAETNPPALLNEPAPEAFPGTLAAFPHVNGYEYVQQAYLEAGWAGVDSLYEDPPTSTHSVLHPDSWWQPVELEPLDDASAELGAGWELVNEGGMGEWLITLFLQTELSGEDSRIAAEGWEADIFQAYGNRSTGETMLVWAAQWQSIPDVYAARKALRDYAGERFGEIQAITQDEITVDASPALRIERTGLQTLLILGPDEELIDTMRDQVIFPFRSIEP